MLPTPLPSRPLPCQPTTAHQPHHVFYVKPHHVKDGLIDHVTIPFHYVTKVVIRNLLVTSLPDAWGTNVVELVCDDCLALTTIPDSFTNLVRLNCSGCINLRSIPFLPHLKTLHCIGCVNLTTLPVLFNLEQLYCDHCITLQEIPNYLFVRIVHCSNCPMLPHQLPTWPNLLCLVKNSCHFYKIPLNKHINIININ